jgi:hypothetical protein
MYKLYLKKDKQGLGFHSGWNTRYITDFAKSVRFYVRGNEFTRQLDYFIGCIEAGNFSNVSSFEEAHKTDILMEQIRMDSANTLSFDYQAPQTYSVMPKTVQGASIWNRLQTFWKRMVKSS